MKCSDITVHEVCYTLGGVRQNLLAHYEYRVNTLGNRVVHAVRYTDVAGVPVDTALGAVTFGACPVPAVGVRTGAGNYSEASVSTSYDPEGLGASWTAPVGLQSFTVAVRLADGVPGGTNRVRVSMSSGDYYMTKGEVRTWSVSQHASGDEFLQPGVKVHAEGVSAFDVIWTVEV